MDNCCFTPGHDWYFYSKTSYLAWDTIGTNNQSVKPYFEHFKSSEIFNDDEKNIRNLSIFIHFIFSAKI